MKLSNLTKFVLALLASFSAGALGSYFTTPSIPAWYATLAKPSFAPPNSVFGPVWTALYLMIGISLYLVWSKNWKVHHHVWTKHKAWNPWSERLWSGDLRAFNTISIFWLHYALNIFWSVAFFTLRSPGLAFFVILGLWISIVYVIVNFYRISKPAAYLLLPYLLWVTFAACLNYSIWILN